MMPFREPPVNGIIYLFVIEYIDMLQLQIFFSQTMRKFNGIWCFESRPLKMFCDINLFIANCRTFFFFIYLSEFVCFALTGAEERRERNTLHYL